MIPVPLEVSLSLSRATLPDGSPLGLPGLPPYACQLLDHLAGVPFDLPCEDPWIVDGDGDEHTYLEAAHHAWDEWPEWMDFTSPDSPAWDLKAASRDLYLHGWEAWLEAERVLDVGCGVGRFALELLDRGATVIGVDADLESLRRLAWHAAGRPGRLELHWTTTDHLPEGTVDLVIAAEVLCYVPDPERVLAELVRRLRPGGAVLVSVESRWGWAAAVDALPGTVEQALSDDPVVHLPGERWVRTYTEDELRALLEGAGLEVQLLAATHYLIDGPLERTLGEHDLGELLDLELRLRDHPVWAPLHRVWTAVGVAS